MKYDLTKPCNECPYVGKWQGWIGSHQTAQDFVDFVRADEPFVCHMLLDQEADLAKQIASGKAQHCAGYALFMNRMCKSSRNKDMLAFQHRLKTECTTEVLWPPDKLVEWHDKKK